MKPSTMQCVLLCMTIACSAQDQETPSAKVKAVYSSASGIGPQKGVMRCNPSDIIKAGGLYYVWYSKGAQASGYDASVWYATSPDGHAWTEKSEALPRGSLGSWDEQSVFTPNILVADGRDSLFGTAVSKPCREV